MTPPFERQNEMASELTAAPPQWLPIRSDSSVQIDSPASGETVRRSLIRRIARWCAATCWNVWCLSSLVILLAVVTAIPLVQLIVLGYLFLVAGRLANGASIRASVAGFESAGRIGIVFASLAVASLPIRLLVHWESVAAIIEPNSASANNLRAASISLAIFATVYLWWAWARGGTLRHFLWPEPLRFLRQAWRPSLWNETADALWRFVVSLRLPMLFWLGVRGAVGTLIWLIPAMVIMYVTREGTEAAAGLVGGLAFNALGYVLLTLPMLQAHFAAEDRFRSMFHWRRVRRELRYAPWSYAGAMFVTLVMLPIPLYLLKVEATPQGIAWLPCLVFVAFMLPARIATGLTLRRCRRLSDESGSGVVGSGSIDRGWLATIWAVFSRWSVRLVVSPAIVIVYLVVLWASQYTSWDGVDTWVRQHALLVPVPFVGI